MINVIIILMQVDLFEILIGVSLSTGRCLLIQYVTFKKRSSLYVGQDKKITFHPN